jgi:acetyl/propionyl-CoA carboxylase alpha subunit
VLADTHGTTLHLCERECSIQRRHQKVVEETPSTALSMAQRAAICAAGVAAARAADYVNAGTVEFLLAPDGQYYFLEMNTRLQVEHPVTEAVTGLDLVRLQIEIAAGRRLALGQAAVRASGHAVECRVYAEDAENGDLPAPGTIRLCIPPAGEGVRFDSGVETGSVVPVHYDPLLAKLICWGEDRAAAIARAEAALGSTVILGVRTNLNRLQEILAEPDFRSGRLDTGFLEQHPPQRQVPDLPDEAFSAVAAALRLGNGRHGRSARAGADVWATLGPWRIAR